MEADENARKMKIAVTKDGPYAVSGGAPLSKEQIGTNGKGESVAWVPGGASKVGASYFLCRCGRSGKKPFCDGTHAKVGFNGQETASRES